MIVHWCSHSFDLCTSRRRQRWDKNGWNIHVILYYVCFGVLDSLLWINQDQWISWHNCLKTVMPVNRRVYSLQSMANNISTRVTRVWLKGLLEMPWAPFPCSDCFFSEETFLLRIFDNYTHWNLRKLTMPDVSSGPKNYFTIVYFFFRNIWETGNQAVVQA